MSRIFRIVSLEFQSSRRDAFLSAIIFFAALTAAFIREYIFNILNGRQSKIKDKKSAEGKSRFLLSSGDIF